MLVLRNARIIPELTEGYDSDRADIVIDNGIIQEIKAPKTVDAGEVLDMTDMTVIPGLIEAHLHLDLKGTNTFEENVQPDAYRSMTALKLAQDNLRQGYTTVRDVGDRNNIVIDIARAVREGAVVAPDILASEKSSRRQRRATTSSAPCIWKRILRKSSGRRFESSTREAPTGLKSWAPERL